jgi:thiol-disulfide isomerase/thioredoxin
MITSLALIALTALPGDGVTMKFVASGATAKAGGYRPLRAEMDGSAEATKKAPEDLETPKYGAIKIDGKSWGFIVDEPEGKPARLFVDSNADGDFTNDPTVTWTPRANGGLTMYQGTARVDFGDGKLASLGLYRFDPTDPRREQLKNTLMYYKDYGYEVTLTLDGKDFSSFVAGGFEPNMALWIDRDGNKQRSFKREMIQVGKPFNFTGTTYVLTANQNEPSLKRAPDELPVAPLPPDLAIGKKALEFEMEATDGTKIEFPKTYAGKIVMLDFWATWCGPCIAELPNVKKAYADWHDQGFEILGISFDRENMSEKLAAFIKENEMPWPQLYEGKYWDTNLGELYDVGSIPFVLLVDGDSGEILGTAKELRGPGLTGFIERALQKKKGS